MFNSKKYGLLFLLVLFLIPSSLIALDLLQEDFDDGVANLFQPIDNYWEVINGQYVCNSLGYEYYSKSFVGNCEWTDYTFECDIKVDETGSINQMVFVRVENTGNYYEINVRGEPWNDVHLFKWTNGVHTDHPVSVPFNNNTGEWHHYRIDVWHNEIRVEFDGQELFTYVDNSNPYTCGGIALVGYSGSIGWQQAIFDNVLVSIHAVQNEDTSWGSIKMLYR
jgi:hypothetical protein